LFRFLFFYVLCFVQKRKFGPISKFGSLSHLPEAPNVVVPNDAYVQPFMVPPRDCVEPQFDGDFFFEEAKKEWGELNADEFEDGPDDMVDLDDLAPLRSKPFGRSEMIISNQMAKGKEELNGKEELRGIEERKGNGKLNGNEEGNGEFKGNEELKGNGELNELRGREEREEKVQIMNQVSLRGQKSPRLTREKTVIVDDLLSVSPREEGRRRAPTSFFIVSPSQSRVKKVDTDDSESEL